MTASRHLFPDRREEAENIAKGVCLTVSLSRPLDEVMAGLRQIDWRHPALIVYREDGDDRWSYVALGLNSPEGLGEGE